MLLWYVTQMDLVEDEYSVIEEMQDTINLVKIAAEQNPADVEALKALAYEDKTVGEALTALIAKIGENMKIRRFARFEGNVCSYTHGEGRIGVMVKADGEVVNATDLGCEYLFALHLNFWEPQLLL